MKRHLLWLFLALSLAVLAQPQALGIDNFGCKQEGETIQLQGRVKNDGMFAAHKIVLEASAVVGEGDGAEEVASQEWEIGDLAGGDVHKFKLTMTSKVKVDSVLMRVKSAKFR